MDWILIPLGAFLWRLRGGLLNDLTGVRNWMGFNDTVVRIIWSLGMAYAWFYFAHLPREALRLAACLLCGTTLIGWMGFSIMPSRWRDVWGLSLSGTLRMSFAAAALSSPWPLLAGILCGPAYWLGARLPHPRPWMFWGEIIFGAVVGAALVATLPIHL